MILAIRVAYSWPNVSRCDVDPPRRVFGVKCALGRRPSSSAAAGREWSARCGWSESKGTCIYNPLVYPRVLPNNTVKFHPLRQTPLLGDSHHDLVSKEHWCDFRGNPIHHPVGLSCNRRVSCQGWVWRARVRVHWSFVNWWVFSKAKKILLRNSFGVEVEDKCGLRSAPLAFNRAKREETDQTLLTRLTRLTVGTKPSSNFRVHSMFISVTELTYQWLLGDGMKQLPRNFIF